MSSTNGNSQQGPSGAGSGSGAPKFQKLALFRLFKLMGQEEYTVWLEEIRAGSAGRMPTQADIDTMSEIYKAYEEEGGSQQPAQDGPGTTPTSQPIPTTVQQHVEEMDTDGGAPEVEDPRPRVSWTTHTRVHEYLQGSSINAEWIAVRDLPMVVGDLQ
jgi:hypothetical protein